MRIVVTSDSHRRQGNLLEIIERHCDDANLFINLGDGEDDVDTALNLYPNLKIERVCGNCDGYSLLPTEKTIIVAGKKIFFTHGHIYGVKHGYRLIEEKAQNDNIDICLFGHTHMPYTNYCNNIHYMNPGAVCNDSYGIIDIVKDSVIVYNANIWFNIKMIKVVYLFYDTRPLSLTFSMHLLPKKLKSLIIIMK